MFMFVYEFSLFGIYPVSSSIESVSDNVSLKTCSYSLIQVLRYIVAQKTYIYNTVSAFTLNVLKFQILDHYFSNLCAFICRCCIKSNLNTLYATKRLTKYLPLTNTIISLSTGASLAQLTNLIHLDLSHNFLRSLSAEPLKSLRQLTELLLHDNDISMIDDEALALHKDLGRFTIEGNGETMIRTLVIHTAGKDGGFLLFCFLY